MSDAATDGVLETTGSPKIDDNLPKGPVTPPEPAGFVENGTPMQLDQQMDDPEFSQDSMRTPSPVASDEGEMEAESSTTSPSAAEISEKIVVKVESEVQPSEVLNGKSMNENEPPSRKRKLSSDENGEKTNLERLKGMKFAKTGHDSRRFNFRELEGKAKVEHRQPLNQEKSRRNAHGPHTPEPYFASDEFHPVMKIFRSLKTLQLPSALETVFTIPPQDVAVLSAVEMVEVLDILSDLNKRRERLTAGHLKLTDEIKAVLNTEVTILNDLEHLMNIEEQMAFQQLKQCPPSLDEVAPLDVQILPTDINLERNTTRLHAVDLLPPPETPLIGHSDPNWDFLLKHIPASMRGIPPPANLSGPPPIVGPVPVVALPTFIHHPPPSLSQQLPPVQPSVSHQIIQISSSSRPQPSTVEPTLIYAQPQMVASGAPVTTVVNTVSEVTQPNGLSYEQPPVSVSEGATADLHTEVSLVFSTALSTVNMAPPSIVNTSIAPPVTLDMSFPPPTIASSTSDALKPALIDDHQIAPVQPPTNLAVPPPGIFAHPPPNAIPTSVVAVGSPSRFSVPPPTMVISAAGPKPIPLMSIEHPPGFIPRYQPQQQQHQKNNQKRRRGGSAAVELSSANAQMPISARTFAKSSKAAEPTTDAPHTGTPTLSEVSNEANPPTSEQPTPSSELEVSSVPVMTDIIRNDDTFEFEIDTAPIAGIDEPNNDPIEDQSDTALGSQSSEPPADGS